MSGTTSRHTKAELLAQVQALMAGTRLQFPSGSFTLANTAFTTASLLQLLQSLVDAMTATNAAQLAVRDALATEQSVKAKVDPVILAYERFLRASFEGAAQPLATFGLAPYKARAPRTGEQIAAAAAKAKATRIARGTASKKKKLAIQGDVTGILVTPVTSAPAAGPNGPSAPAAPQPTPTTPAAAPPGSVAK